MSVDSPPARAKTVRYYCHQWCFEEQVDSADKFTVGIDGDVGWYFVICANCGLPCVGKLKPAVVALMENSGCQVADAML